MIFSNTSSQVIGLVASGFVIAFIMSVGMGANDVANAFGTAYGAKIMSLIQIVIVASIFEVLGAVLIGLKVSDTIRNGIVGPIEIENEYTFSTDCVRRNYTAFANSTAIFNSSINGTIILSCAEMIQIIGSISALSGSSVWMVIANIFRLPVSTTHSIVGSSLGYGLVVLQGKGIIWDKLIYIVVSWFVSPVVSGLLSLSIYVAVYKTILQKPNPFKAGLKAMPIFYFITVALSIFSVFFKGSELLYFNRIPLWGVIILSAGSGTFTAILAWKLLVPYLRNKYSSISEAPSSSLTNGNSTQSHDDFVSNSHRSNIPIVGNRIRTSTRSTNEIIAAEDVIRALDENTSNGMTENSENNTKKGSTETKGAKSINQEDHRTFHLFRYLQIIIACYGSFAHGGNDVSNSVAPLMSVWLLFKKGRSAGSSLPPIWLLLYGACGMVVGLAIWGKRVLRTVGEDITQITPATGFCIELGSTFTVIGMTRIGIPISTTHCKIGSVVVLGWYRYGLKSVKAKLLISIVLSWIITVPVSGLISAAVCALIQRVLIRL